MLGDPSPSDLPVFHTCAWNCSSGLCTESEKEGGGLVQNTLVPPTYIHMETSRELLISTSDRAQLSI